MFEIDIVIFKSDAVLLSLGFIGGIVTSFAQGWVSDFFKRQQDKRSRTQRIIDHIADTLSAVYSKNLTTPDKAAPLMQKSANQLEGLGQENVAEYIREVMKLWYFLAEWKGEFYDKEYIEKAEKFKKLTKKITVAKIQTRLLNFSLFKSLGFHN